VILDDIFIQLLEFGMAWFVVRGLKNLFDIAVEEVSNAEILARDNYTS
jgi:hypothetical protein